MNLLFAINQRVLPQFSSSIRSIVKNGGEDRYEAYILHSDLKAPQQETVRQAAGERVTCHFVPVDPTLFDGFPETKRYPRQIYYRLYLAHRIFKHRTLIYPRESHVYVQNIRAPILLIHALI